ncbi:MAG: Fic family protein [Clostridiales bacterium]|nr:Fic family protein [Candidatus Crickella caballi]
MSESYKASLLPLSNELIDYKYFFDELLDATARLEVYKEKIKDSKLDSSWFMPTLQRKEALASSLLEGTQATLDGVLTNQVTHSNTDQNINEVLNYYKASEVGLKILCRDKFSDNFFKEIHETLMIGNVRKPDLIGAYRTEQNYIGKNNSTHDITFVPPVPEDVPMLMNNLISYMNNPQDSFRPLVRIAIIHAQFESIHPFMDGNGRVGRLLIPMYLFAENQIELPYFFVSEALEHDKLKYYTLLNNIRTKNDWNSWIKFFLDTVSKQCDKYIGIISEINKLYDKHITIASDFAKSSNVIPIMNTLYKYPITSAKQLSEETGVPMTSVNRLLNMMVENEILISDGRQRNRTFVYADLLSIIR